MVNFNNYETLYSAYDSAQYIFALYTTVHCPLKLFNKILYCYRVWRVSSLLNISAKGSVINMKFIYRKTNGSTYPGQHGSTYPGTLIFHYCLYKHKCYYDV